MGLVEDADTGPLRAGMLANTAVAYIAAWGRAVFFADNLLADSGLFAVGTWLRNLLIYLVSGRCGCLPRQRDAVGHSAGARPRSRALVILAIRHRVDFRSKNDDRQSSDPDSRPR